MCDVDCVDGEDRAPGEGGEMEGGKAGEGIWKIGAY